MSIVKSQDILCLYYINYIFNLLFITLSQISTAVKEIAKDKVTITIFVIQQIGFLEKSQLNQ